MATIVPAVWCSVSNTYFSELLHNLHKVGFRTTLGDDDSGFLIMAFARLGGYYLGKNPLLGRRTLDCP